MSYDPQQEDYQRLGLRFLHSLNVMGASDVARIFATFDRKFIQDRDSLPQSDVDRAFFLVTAATKSIDYELPFTEDEEAEQIIVRGHQLLDEALELDENCFDAIRMKAAADSPSFDSFYAFLADRADEVRRICKESCKSLSSYETDGEWLLLARDIAMRPYLRWLAALAEQALICGRNKESLRWAHMALKEDPADMADVRFTATLAYAKLEDEDGLDSLHENVGLPHLSHRTNNAWTLIARAAIAYKRLDLEAATQALETIRKLYPDADETLIRQMELPDGVFARLPTPPYSNDELLLALSEATVLLQEGFDPQNRGVLSTWVRNYALEHASQEVISSLSAEGEEGAS